MKNLRKHEPKLLEKTMVTDLAQKSNNTNYLVSDKASNLLKTVSLINLNPEPAQIDESSLLESSE